MSSHSSTFFTTSETSTDYATSSSLHNTQDFNPTSEEQSLWRAVIVQLLMDASSMSKKAEMQQYKREALVWLRGNSKDFITVCHYAGFDPECTKQLIKEALDNGCKWRAAPGMGKRQNKRPLSKRTPTNNR